jgi:hypothetical protein
MKSSAAGRRRTDKKGFARKSAAQFGRAREKKEPASSRKETADRAGPVSLGRCRARRPADARQLIGTLFGMLMIGPLAVPAAPAGATPKTPAPAPVADPVPAAPADRPSPADPDCLTITRASAATFVIANGRCPDQSVLTAIALDGDGALARCFTKKIRSRISLASDGAMPLINYQCIEGTPGCSVETLRGMFPECRAN